MYKVYFHIPNGENYVLVYIILINWIELAFLHIKFIEKSELDRGNWSDFLLCNIKKLFTFNFHYYLLPGFQENNLGQNNIWFVNKIKIIFGVYKSAAAFQNTCSLILLDNRELCVKQWKL